MTYIRKVKQIKNGFLFNPHIPAQINIGYNTVCQNTGFFWSYFKWGETWILWYNTGVKVYLWYNTGEALVILNMLQRVQVTVSGKLYRKANPFSNYDVILRCLELCTKLWTSRPQLITLALHKKWKFFIKDIFGKCDQIRIFLWSWSHLLKKSSIKKLHFYAV